MMVMVVVVPAVSSKEMRSWHDICTMCVAD